MFNPVVPYEYMLPNMYLFIADITNPDSFMFNGLVLTSPAFVRSSAKHPAGPQCRLAQKTVKTVGWFDTICTACGLCRYKFFIIPLLNVHVSHPYSRVDQI